MARTNKKYSVSKPIPLQPDEPKEKSITDLLADLRKEVLDLPPRLTRAINDIEHHIRNQEQELIGWKDRFSNLRRIGDTDSNLPLEKVDSLLDEAGITSADGLRDFIDDRDRVVSEYVELSACDREKIPQWLKRELDVISGEERVPVVC